MAAREERVCWEQWWLPIELATETLNRAAETRLATAAAWRRVLDRVVTTAADPALYVPPLKTTEKIPYPFDISSDKSAS